jgi:hypothetical protein
LRIEEELGSKAVYAGKNFRFPYSLIEWFECAIITIKYTI